MDIQQALDQLAEYQFQLDALQCRENDLVAELTPKIPDDIKKKIDDIHVEFTVQRRAAESSASELHEQIKLVVLAQGKSEKGKYLQAIYVRGRVTWDTSKLDGLMIAVPQLKELRKESEPSVSFRSTK